MRRLKRSRGVTALAAAGVFAAGFAAAVLPADAAPRTITVTLLGGATLNVVVDVPPGTPLDQIRIPGIKGPIIGISDSGPVSSPETPSPSPTEGAVPPSPTATPDQGLPDAPRADESDKATRGKRQKTVKRKSRKDNQEDATSEQLAAAADTIAKRRQQREAVRLAGRSLGGVPTTDNPAFSLAIPGAAPIGVPNFMIDKFRIPPFLLPIYQAAGIEYGIRWEVLAAINEIETDYGRNLNISSAGALGWMQFLPSTWKIYGVDANRDGSRDPYNPVDAIFSAARYLRAAGAEKDLRKAVFAYNHADWYVDSVVLRARLIGGLPANFVGSLTGLTQAQFPVRATARYADDISEAEATRRVRHGKNAAFLVNADRRRRGINIYAKAGAPVVAVNEGRIAKIGQTKRLGRFIQLQDVYGNTFTYAHLKKISQTYLAPKVQKISRDRIRDELSLPKVDAQPTTPASAGAQGAREAVKKAKADTERALDSVAAGLVTNNINRLLNRAAKPAVDPLAAEQAKGYTTFSPFSGSGLKVQRQDTVRRALKPGARVVAGTLLGRVGVTSRTVAPHVLFEIRPAGRGAPRIDPKPILDGWKLLESTAIYRAAGRNPLHGDDAKTPSIGQILLSSKEELVQRVLANPRIDVYQCGRQDIRAGIVDRRVLATLEFLAASGLKPTVTSLRCGHGYYTSSGNVSHHSSGNAVDIAAVNGIPILGHQGAGSITEIAVQRLLTLQGTMKPDQIITLMTFKGADNTFAMGDHADHIHVGWRPLFGTNSKLAKQVNAVLKPDQWIKLVDRLARIDNPTVRTTPSDAAIETVKRASDAHESE